MVIEGMPSKKLEKTGIWTPVLDGMGWVKFYDSNINSFGIPEDKNGWMIGCSTGIGRDKGIIKAPYSFKDSIKEIGAKWIPTFSEWEISDCHSIKELVKVKPEIQNILDWMSAHKKGWTDL